MPPELPHIPYDRPYIAPQSLQYLEQICRDRALHGNGTLTQACEAHLRRVYGYGPLLLTTSCTHALEMTGLLLDLRPGDEVIVPSFTFPATATAYALRGATLRFADSLPHHPNIDPASVARLLNARTRAVVIVHYAGMAADLPLLLDLCAQANVPLIEDAAHALHASFQNQPLGSFGHWATLSFGSTKNINAGKGGALVFNDLGNHSSDSNIDNINNTSNIDNVGNINSPNNPDNQSPHAHTPLTDTTLPIALAPAGSPPPADWARAECILEVGTNKRAFSRREVPKYQCVTLGSSYYIGELNAAFLLPQLAHAAEVTARRRSRWQHYQTLLAPLAQQGFLQLPVSRPDATHNGHIFYVRCRSLAERDALTAYLQQQRVGAVFHYQPLHASPYFGPHNRDACPNAQLWADCLLRLPLFHDLQPDQQAYIAGLITDFFKH